MHCVDLGESFQMHIYVQNLVLIQPRTNPVKFARSSIPQTAAKATSAGNYADSLAAAGSSLAESGLFSAVAKGQEVTKASFRVQFGSLHQSLCRQSDVQNLEMNKTKMKIECQKTKQKEREHGRTHKQKRGSPSGGSPGPPCARVP